MIFIINPKKLNFIPYSHKQYLRQGTVCRLQNGDLVLIDADDRENSSSFKELNYYCFKVKENYQEISLKDYNDTRYRMINQDEIISYSKQKIYGNERK